MNGLPGGDVVDPLTVLPFPDNRIPARRISGVSRKLLDKYYLAPNVDVPVDDLNYRVLEGINEHTDGYDLRLDRDVIVLDRTIPPASGFLVAINSCSVAFTPDRSQKCLPLLRPDCLKPCTVALGQQCV